ncbi:hypothetical protein MNV49_005636 [Pseudohyphozyma bogoriensis]|nr:hypothetical protein MNV49_005636 [Pseudohyphozyma bogoriensis]
MKFWIPLLLSLALPVLSADLGLSLLSTGVLPATSVSVIVKSVAALAAATANATAASGGGNSTETAAAASAATTTSASAKATTSASAGDSSAQAASTTSAAAAAASTSAASSGSATDLVVLNLALTLENLETQFYTEALKTISLKDMVNAGLSESQATVIIEEVQNIQIEESTHASTLTAAITAAGGTPSTACSFGFKAFDFLGHRSVPRTGAAALLSDKALLTAAGSILTLEARHQSLLNTFNAGSFTSQAFDIALSANQVLTLAGGFLNGCQASDLGLTAGNPLSIVDKQTQSTRFQIDSQLQFTSNINLTTAGTLSCHMLVGGAPASLVFDASACTVPKGINGPVAVFLANSTTPIQSNLLNQDTRGIVAGPGLIFVDSVSSSLGSLFAVNGNNNRASANLGGYYVNKMNGNNNQIIVVETDIIINQQVIQVIQNNGGGSSSSDGNGNDGKDGDKKKSSKRGKGFERRRRSPRHGAKSQKRM